MQGFNFVSGVLLEWMEQRMVRNRPSSKDSRACRSSQAEAKGEMEQGRS